MALKKNMDTSVHIQNFYLYFFGLLFNTVGLALLVVLGHQSVSELFKGHSKVCGRLWFLAHVQKGMLCIKQDLYAAWIPHMLASLHAYIKAADVSGLSRCAFTVELTLHIG